MAARMICLKRSVALVPPLCFATVASISAFRSFAKLARTKMMREFQEVLEFAEYLEHDLLWIAREGVVAPVPAPLKAFTENGDDVFYFNFEAGESIWDHPSDENYRQLLQVQVMQLQC